MYTMYVTNNLVDSEGDCREGQNRITGNCGLESSGTMKNENKRMMVAPQKTLPSNSTDHAGIYSK